MSSAPTFFPNGERIAEAVISIDKALSAEAGTEIAVEALCGGLSVDIDAWELSSGALWVAA
ncbi:hypothetical protein [Rhizobium sp. 2MFCol3.1]|uniref:hypothetical protein n=1 Tax=Rhizobium sp. 2MFCol3.1 TaxID=1246459 RepID=UPI000374594D|nr:hypothetical protein [Rhizobium sp. 2MFCol3.1]